MTRPQTSSELAPPRGPCDSDANAIDAIVIITPAGPLTELEQSPWAVLAALRFFLAMVVVLGHCCSLIGRSDWTYVGLWFNQGSAVFGFFIISGYSIAASVERDIEGFYRRRVLRIGPLYFGCICFGILVSLRVTRGFLWPTGVPLPPITAGSVAASLFMLQTIVAPSIPVVGQIWSLSPEWWHYMAAPVLKRFPTVALLAMLGLSYAAFLLIPPPSGGGPENFNDGLGLLTLSWFWVTGFIYRRFDRRPIGIAVLIIPSAYAAALGYFVGAPLFITILVLLVSGKLGVPRCCQRICHVLGDISFPLYLFHIPCMLLMLTFGVTSSACMVVASLLVSSAALYAIDSPCRRRFRVAPARLISG